MSDVVAVLGLGNMGTPIARCLHQAGFSVRVWNRTARAPDLVPGALVAHSIDEAVTGAGFVLTMLADDVAVEAVTFAPDGLLANLDTEGVHIGASTISPDLARRLEAAHDAAGRRYISAPVGGRPEVAAAAALRIFAGGPAALVTHCQPLLSAIGRQTWLFSSPAQANLAKLINNFVAASLLEAMGEALTMAEKAGIATEIAIEMLTALGAGVPPTYAPMIAHTRFTPAAFTLELGLKDLALARGAAEALSVPLPLADLMLAKMAAAIDQGRGHYDWSAMATITRESAGLPPVRSEPRTG